MTSVLVTGAARGIGRVTVLELADAGWEVFAGVRTEADGAALVAATSGSFTPVILDVTDPGHIAALDDVLPAQLRSEERRVGKECLL